jgi:YVTN family beta-propeller protein
MKQYQFSQFDDFSPYNIALNPRTHKLYIIDYDQGVTYVINSVNFSMICKIPVMPLPEEIVVNPKTGFIYVSNREATRVAVINGNNDHFVKNIVTANYSRDFATDSSLFVDPISNLVYLADYERKAIIMINGTTNTIARTVFLDFSPADISFNTKTGDLFIYDDQSGRLARLAVNGTVIHLLGFKVQNHIKSESPRINTINIGKGASEIGIDNINNRTYVLNIMSRSIYVIDTNSNSVTDIIRMEHKPSHFGIIPERNLLLVTYKGISGIYMIDPVSKHTIGKLDTNTSTNFDINSNLDEIIFASPDKDNSIIIGVSAEDEMNRFPVRVTHPQNVAVNSVDGNIYLSGSNLATIDRSRNESKIFSSSVISDPGPIAINELTNMIYVLANRYYDNHYLSLYAIDGYTNRIEYTLNLKQPLSFNNIAVNERTSTIYATGNDAETKPRGILLIVNGSTNQPVKNITLGVNPTLMAVDPDSNIIYVVDGDTRSLFTIDGKNNELVPAWNTITFEVSPHNSGDLFCNGNKVNDQVVNYGYGTQLKCQVKPSQNFVFESWSGSISNMKDSIDLRVVEGGKLQANLSELPSPPNYWQIFTVVIGVIGIGTGIFLNREKLKRNKNRK